jgi:Cu/Ag efflux pump CusA
MPARNVAADHHDDHRDDAGMIPSALAFSDGGEFRAPMAYLVIGGLLCSTGLSSCSCLRCSY